MPSYTGNPDQAAWITEAMSPDVSYRSFRLHPTHVPNGSSFHAPKPSDTDNNSWSADPSRSQSDYSCNSQGSILLLPSCCLPNRHAPASADTSRFGDSACEVRSSSRSHSPSSYQARSSPPHIRYILSGSAQPEVPASCGYHCTLSDSAAPRSHTSESHTA